MLFPRKEEVIEIHRQLLGQFGGPPGLRDEGLLDSALLSAAHRQHYEGADLPTCAATYAFHLTRNHPFVDGNKRAGAAVAEIFVRLNGARLSASNDAIVELFLGIAAGTVSREDVEQAFARWVVVPSSHVRMLGPGDAAVLDRVAADVFDHPIDPRWAAEFLADPRHHLAVAVADGRVVGMASGVHYVHPDKPPELWVNEVGVAPAHRNQGVGRRLLAALFERGRAVGCAAAWVGTERSNAAARRLYAAAGGTEDPEDVVLVTFRLGPEG